MVLVPSGQKYSSFLMSKEPMLLGGILVLTDGTNAATVTVYDNNVEVAAGGIAWKETDVGTNNYGGMMFPHPIKLNVGCYIVLSGTGASFIAYEAKL